jgi:hypothetical protein
VLEFKTGEGVKQVVLLYIYCSDRRGTRYSSTTVKYEHSPCLET